MADHTFAPLIPTLIRCTVNPCETDRPECRGFNDLQTLFSVYVNQPYTVHSGRCFHLAIH